MPEESIEMTVARLDERFRGFQSAVTQMADDQRRMAESYERLVESNQRIALVEAEVLSLKDSQKQLWVKFDTLASSEAKSSQQWMWEIGKTLLTVVGAVVAYKLFGVHL